MKNLPFVKMLVRCPGCFYYLNDRDFDFNTAKWLCPKCNKWWSMDVVILSPTHGSAVKDAYDEPVGNDGLDLVEAKYGA